MSLSNTLLSIIIANYNTSDITLDCLKSIYSDLGLKKIPFEIIIIDNHSSDDSIQKITRYRLSHRLNNLKLISNSKNLGFAKANNQGFKLSTGNYILMINSDTINLHSSISQCLDWLSSHPEAGSCTAQLLNPDLSIQSTGGYFPNLLNIFTWCLGLDDLPLVNKIVPPLHPHTPSFYTHDNYYLHNHQQDWLTGAFILTRREIIEKCGGFDESYFMYGEELEMMYRIRILFPNYQNWYLVGPQIIHIGRGSSLSSSFALEREKQGIISFFQKHHPKQVPVVKFLITINTILRRSLYSLFKKDV